MATAGIRREMSRLVYLSLLLCRSDFRRSGRFWITITRVDDDRRTIAKVFPSGERS